MSGANAAATLPPPPGTSGHSLTVGPDAGAGAIMVGENVSYDALSPDHVFNRIDQNRDGVITRNEFEAAVYAGALVVEEEPPQDSWIDALGRTVYGGVPPADPPIIHLKPERSVLTSAAAAPGSRNIAGGVGTTTTTDRTSINTQSVLPPPPSPGVARSASVGATSTSLGAPRAPPSGPPSGPPPGVPPGPPPRPTTVGGTTYVRSEDATPIGAPTVPMTGGPGGLGSATARAPAPVAPPKMRPVQPEGSPWAHGQAATGAIADGQAAAEQADAHAEIGHEKGCRTSFCDAVLWRLGLSAVFGSDGQGDLGLYCKMKNNELNNMFAHMRNVWVFVGFFVLVMLVVIPVWNANRLLQDPAYTYFAGKTVPRAILSVCLSLPIFYACTVSLIFKRGALKMVSEQTMLGVGLVFLTALGFSLTLASFPLGSSAATTYQDIVGACATGYKVRELYQTSQALLVLRTDPACQYEFTVASCAGYSATPYTEVLQAMENDYKCSGFCFNPAVVKAADNGPKGGDLVPAVALMQIEQHRHQHRRKKHSPRGVAAPIRPAPLQLKIPAVPKEDQEVIVSQSDKEAATAATSAASEAMKEMKKVPLSVRERQLWSKKSDSQSAAASVRGAQASASAAKIMTQAQSEGIFQPISADLSAGWASGGPGGATQWAPGQPNGAMTYPQVAADGALIPTMLAADNAIPSGQNSTAPYAPTLFSATNYKASCDGMAANQMLHYVGDVAVQSFYQGVLLIFFAITLGFMQLLGFCYAPKGRY